MALKKGAEFECEIESTAFKGKGVAKVDGIAVFIHGTAPGDIVRARVIKKKKKFREAKLLEILEPSPHRIEPECGHANVCGGCTWQHIPYNKQIEYKEQHVRDHAERLAGLDPSLVKPIIGAEKPFYYRNKMEYSFGTKRWLTDEEINRDEYVDDTAFTAGLHAPGRYDKILNLKECHLQDPVSYRILDSVRAYCIKNGIPAYDTHEKSGFIRHLMIRNSFYTDDLMVNLVTFNDDPELMEKLKDLLLAEFPEITTIVNNVNDQPNPTAIGRFENVLFGKGFIVDKIGGYSFKIHPNAFFQTNTKQAETLYDTALNFADIQPGERVFDLYCGVGTLSLYLCKKADHVVGVELVDVAIKNANQNAKENGISNIEFVKGDMKDTFNAEFMEQHGRPDCIVTDPPRSGMHPDVVKHLVELKVPKLIYVSCNPSTQARDLKELKEVYNIEAIQPVDMFPQTYHIEAVAKLTVK